MTTWARLVAVVVAAGVAGCAAPRTDVLLSAAARVEAPSGAARTRAPHRPPSGSSSDAGRETREPGLIGERAPRRDRPVRRGLGKAAGVVLVVVALAAIVVAVAFAQSLAQDLDERYGEGD